MMNEIIKLKLWVGGFFCWGLLTGRCLPQWEDIANSKLLFAEVIIYWIMILIGLFVLWQQHKLPITKQKGE